MTFFVYHYLDEWSSLSRTKSMLPGEDAFSDVVVGRVARRKMEHLQLKEKSLSYEGSPSGSTDFLERSGAFKTQVLFGPRD